MSNVIEIYQSNSKRISVTVSGLSDITGYNSYLSVKNKESDASTVILSGGIIQDPCSLIFDLTPTDTSLAVGDYLYDINLELDNSTYTIQKNVFSILDGVRY